MTSSFATNFVEDKLSRVRYLRVNENGQPLQGQVPLTYQRYSGNGNTTITYDGSDVIVISSALSAGALTIDFSAMNNWLGRSAQVIVQTALTNSVILDFGVNGDLYIPPSATAVTSATLSSAISPVAAKVIFFAIDKAMLVTNSATNTYAGPKCLTFQVSTDAANDLNTASAELVAWVDDPTKDDTTLTANAGSIGGTIVSWEPVDESVYDISYSLFIVGDPTIVYRAFIGIDSDVYAYQESTLGLTGQTLSGNLKIRLTGGELIGIYCGNVEGPVTPVAPLDTVNGLVCITQFI